MSHHLTHREPIARQLHRMVQDDIALAVEALRPAAPDADAIHEARKSVKRVRAMLRLLERPLGRDYHFDGQLLRQAAHALAALRDADATTETLRSLRSRFPSVLTAPVVSTVARGLRGRKRRVRLRAGHSLRMARRALEEAARSVPAHVARAGNFHQVREGALRGYRRSRKALLELGDDSGAARFHRWRLRLKEHWYHVRLFEGMHAMPRSRARALERLEGWLGDDHNLAMLRGVILANPARYGNARTTALVLGCITKSQARLRAQALRLGRRMFSERPRDFDRALSAWWRGPSTRS